MGRWWEGRPEERFWLESTDRDDLGTDLRAPITDEAGRDNWRYTLFREARVGDCIFHYDKKRKGIVAASYVTGPPVNTPIVWAARGSYARERGAMPVETQGYRLPLRGFAELSEPVSLEELRAAKPALLSIVEALPRGPHYFPFELSKRPVRPLQGYAFKLPSTFVAAFPSLEHAILSADEKAAAGQATQGSDRDALTRFRELIAAIEDNSGRFAIAELQRRRAAIRGLKRVPRSIFGRRVLAEDWAFHYGGRDELQFNVGLEEISDDGPAFRAGVAFSLEPSRSLPDVAVMEPKIARFNTWMRNHPEELADMAMWYWYDGHRSPDLTPGPIAPEIARSGHFVFVGTRETLVSANPLTALSTFDRLMPLWEWVEGGATPSAMGPGQPEPLDTLRLDTGRDIDGGRWTTATTRERTLDIYLRHAEIQRRLKAELLSEGCTEVVLEPKIGRRSVDLVARHGAELWIYEVKAGGDDRMTLREAIGQLLEYALWPGATKPDRLVVVGEAPLSERGTEYLCRLNVNFPVPIAYRQLSL